jgi:hypothetical protein
MKFLSNRDYFNSNIQSNEIKMKCTGLYFLFIYLFISSALGQNVSKSDCKKYPFQFYNVDISNLGFCQMDTLSSLNDFDNSSYYYYCDSNYFSFYPLVPDSGIFLLEIKANTGTGGYHYYFLERNAGNLLKIGFYQGYLDSINCFSSSNINCVTFSSWIERYRYTVKYIYNGISFSFDRVVGIVDSNGIVPPKEKFKALIKENGNPGKWKL